MTLTRIGLAVALATTLPMHSALAEGAGSISEALSGGNVALHLRARYEAVEEASLEDAAATTLKTRLTYTSGTYGGFGLTLEMDDVTEVRQDDYSNGVASRGTPVIADPEVTEVNQAYITYSNWSTTFKYGRQRILLDNQRFVGGVGWRQDEQTFDALSVSSQPYEMVEVFVSYVTQANRIFAEALDHNHETWLANAKYTSSHGAATAYSYLIDISNPGAVGLSSDTVGLRWNGNAGAHLSYTLEYATQSEGGTAAIEYTADYLLAEFVAKGAIADTSVELKLGHEVLGSHNGLKAFTTPLATLHAFQGWTDRFLATPDAGVQDTYVWLGANLGKFNVGAVYHSFAADYGDTDYGSEVGLMASTTLGPVGLTMKYADYSADVTGSAAPFASDTNKLWLMAAVAF